MRTDSVRMLEFAQHGDERGHLVVVEGMKDIPFEIKRVFYIYGSDADVVRGCHANRRSEFVLINVAGQSKVRVRDGAVQGLDLHFDRLRQGNSELFGAALDEVAVRGWMRQASAASGGDCSLRVTVFSRHFDHRRPQRELPVDVLVTASAPVVPVLQPLRVRSGAWQRPLPPLKHVGMFALHHHRRQAVLAAAAVALVGIADAVHHQKIYVAVVAVAGGFGGSFQLAVSIRIEQAHLVPHQRRGGQGGDAQAERQHQSGQQGGQAFCSVFHSATPL